MNVKQLVFLLVLYTACAIAGLDELFTQRAATYGAYAHAGMLTACIMVPIAALGLIIIVNQFSAEFQREAARKNRAAELQRVTAIANNTAFWEFVTHQLKKKLSLLLDTFKCTVRVVQVDDSHFALSIIYSLDGYQIGYDNIMDCSDKYNAEKYVEVLIQRYNTLYEHSGIRVGLDRYHHYKKIKII